MVSIDKLPDDALLEIFDHYMFYFRHKLGPRYSEGAWKSLAHVCHRWRRIVFEAPRRLDLQLFCTGRTPARDRLGVWPTLPLIIQVDSDNSIRSVDNIIAALECTDRVCQINLVHVESSNMEILLAAMQQPFPDLTYLDLWPWSYDETVSVPDSFLGGSASHLESLSLRYIPFPGLPTLLLSATHLVDLTLWRIPHSGYFTPNAMANALSTLISLDNLELQFISARSCPDRESPPSTRSVVPGLTRFVFRGVSEYLEDLIARIDAPQLETLHITFFNDIVFDTPQLIQFISRTPGLQALEKAIITLWPGDHTARVEFTSQTLRDRRLAVEIACKGLYWQLSSLEQVCTSGLAPLSLLEDLYFELYGNLNPDWEDDIDIYDYYRDDVEDPQADSDWKNDIDNELWVELLRPFSAVKNLYLAEYVASFVAPALQELVEGRTTEVLPTVLPALQNIFVEKLESSGSVQEGIRRFVAAQQVAGHPIAVSRWERGMRY